MAMLVILALTVVCLLDPSAVALHPRENINVLVPNNNVNVHAKLKTLLNGDEVDREDLNEDEFEKIKNDVKFVKIFKGEKGKDEEFGAIPKVDVEVTSERVSTTPSFLSTLDDREASKDDRHRGKNETTTTPFFNQTTTDYWETPTEPNRTSPVQTSTRKLSETVSYGLSTPRTSSSDLNLTTTQVSPSTRFETTLNVTTWSPTTDLNGTTWSTTSDRYFTSTPLNDSTAPEPSTIQTSPGTTIVFETLPTTTDPPFESPVYDDLRPDECFLAKSERPPKWVNTEGTLDFSHIHEKLGSIKLLDLSRRFTDQPDYDRFMRSNESDENIQGLKFLSAAYNNLHQSPYDLLHLSNHTLQYLSLAGNNFSNEDSLVYMKMPNLKELDLRNTKLNKLTRNYLSTFDNLEFLYLSDNHITEIKDNQFPPSLIYLDLSFNRDPTENINEGLNIPIKAFEHLNSLRFLDFSYTKIKTKSLTILEELPMSLEAISLCHTELPKITENFLVKSPFIKLLDISGNKQLELTREMFSAFAESLEFLFVRDANVKDLRWTTPLINLKRLNLFDNSIRSVTSENFEHMAFLEFLSLEKNSIDKWYRKLFASNQKLKFLNLRENKLDVLTEEMKEDMSSVEGLAIGKNKFECRCELAEFMSKLFDATKNAKVSQLRERIESENEIEELIYDDPDVKTETTRVMLGVRNQPRPEYDIISRTYQKYYQMLERSSEALKIRTKLQQSSRKLVLASSTGRELTPDDFTTLLFDYDEDNDDYQCMNETTKEEQSIISMSMVCPDSNRDDDSNPPPYNGKNATITSLLISIPTVVIVSCLVIIVYWRWWYIKYFFVLCKNSAILTFMDDSDGGKDAIITGKNDEPVETFLYDVFVSYSDQNRDWVLDEFIPNVEKRESINVCLHERDFQVGYGILENIVSCMDRSRCLLMLVSENFLLSQWCQFEMNLAQHRLLETRREKLILVLLEDIPVRKQPKTLKYLMRTKTYIKWPVSGSAEEKTLFWKRLKKSIISSKWETENYGSIV